MNRPRLAPIQSTPDPSGRWPVASCAACGRIGDVEPADELGEVCFCRSCLRRGHASLRDPFLDTGVVD